MNPVQLIEAGGWIGMVLILVVYVANPAKRLSASSRFYQSANAGGAIGIGANAFVHKDWPVVLLEFVRAGAALVALVKNNVKR